MQSKVAQLVDLFLANDHYDDPPPESQSTGGSTTTNETTVSITSARTTHSPSSEPINRTDHDPSDMNAEDHEVHLRMYPFLDPTDWILRIDENTPCLSYVVSKLWSWEQIKHCICYELRLHASCTPRQIGEVTDYYYQPCNNTNNNSNTHDGVIHQPRPICNRADFLNAIQRPPALHTNTTNTSNRSYHHVLDILVTCKPLNSAPPPTSQETDTRESHPSSDTTVVATLVAKPTLTDIGMAEALMGLRTASAAATAVGETESIGPKETVEPWHDDGEQVGIDVLAKCVPHDQCTSSSSHGIDIWNRGPQDNKPAHIHNNDDLDCRSQVDETTTMPPPATPTLVHSCNTIHGERSHHVDEHSEAQDNDVGDEDDDQYDDGVAYPYSETSDDDSQLEPPTVDNSCKKRSRTENMTDAKTLLTANILPCAKKPGRLKSPSSYQNQQKGVCIETTTMTTTSGIILPVLNPYDVMCSRSKVAFKAIGNRRLRIIMELHAARYATTFRKVDKTAIVSSIVEIVNGAGGNFIRRNRTTGIWEIAPNEIAKEKVGHGLRDAVGNMGRSIYDVLGHEYYSKIHRKKDVGQILLQPIVCQPPPEPPVPVPKTSRCSLTVTKPSYVSKTIPVRFGSPCKKSHGYPRTSYGPFKKRLLLDSSPISGVKASAKKADANKKAGNSSPLTFNNKSPPPFGGVNESAGKPVATNTAGNGSRATLSNKSPPPGGVNELAGKPVATNIAGIESGATLSNKSPPSGGVSASADTPVVKYRAGIGSATPPSNKSPTFGAVNASAGKPVAKSIAGNDSAATLSNKSSRFGGVNASTGKPVAKNKAGVGSPAAPNSKSRRSGGVNAPADKRVATNIPGIATLGTLINKSPSFFVFKPSTGKTVAKHIPGMGTPGPPIIKSPRFVTGMGTPIGKSPPLVLLKAPVGKRVTMNLAGISTLRIPNSKGRPRSKCRDAEAASAPRAKRQHQMVTTTSTTTRATRACVEASVTNAPSAGASTSVDAVLDATVDLANFKRRSVAACQSTTTTGASNAGFIPSSAV